VIGGDRDRPSADEINAYIFSNIFSPGIKKDIRPMIDECSKGGEGCAACHSELDV
jgi:hypothetical protein